MVVVGSEKFWNGKLGRTLYFSMLERKLIVPTEFMYGVVLPLVL